MIHICHLSSVHLRFDTRIFLKECRSLAQHGYKVSLVVADGKRDEHKDGVDIYDVGAPSGRLDRIRNITRRVLKKAHLLDAEIYHLHDPELLPVGWKLKKMGKKVIFDSHEDVPKQILTKHYMSAPNRWILSNVFTIYERWICAKLDAIVAATPYIREKFLTINPMTLDVNNYPMLYELSSNIGESALKQPWVAYIGGISDIRGITEVIRSMELVPKNIELKLGGHFCGRATERACKATDGWGKVDELGVVDREMVRQILAGSIAGIVTFLPKPNHINAQPNKMFEYMSASVPVIGSNFDLWRQIIEGNNCGICVDPSNPKEIAEAICYLYENPLIVLEMGRNGRKAVEEKYNWQIEEKKLLELYSILMCRSPL